MGKWILSGALSLMIDIFVSIYVALNIICVFP